MNPVNSVPPLELRVDRQLAARMQVQGSHLLRSIMQAESSDHPHLGSARVSGTGQIRSGCNGMLWDWRRGGTGLNGGVVVERFRHVVMERSILCLKETSSQVRLRP